MRTLVAKDFRLAADALRPLAAIIAGLVVIIIGLGFVPASLAPSILREFDLALAFQFVALTTLGLSGLIAAWVTASVLLGDRLHRAGAFEASVPVSWSARQVSKGIAIAGGWGAVVLVGATTALVSHRSRPGSTPSPALPGNWLELVGYIVLTSAIGITLAVGVSRAVRRVETVVALVVGIAIVAAFLGAVVGWGTGSMSLRSLVAANDEFSAYFLLDETAVRSVLASARSFGLMAASATVAAVVGLARGRLAPRSRGKAMALATVAIAAALASGAWGGWFAAARHISVMHAREEEEQLHRIHAMTDGELAASAAEYVAQRLTPAAESALPPALVGEYAFRMNEIARRLSRLSDEAFDRSSLAKAMLDLARSGERGSEVARNALWRLGERGLALAIEFSTQPNRDALQWGRYAVSGLLTDEAERRAFELEWRGKGQDTFAVLLAEQLEAAADRGHPLAKELRAAAANLRSQAAKDPTP